MGAQFQTIVQQAADGILVVDAEGVVLFANPASELLLGRPATELTGTRLGQPIVVDGSTEMAILRRNGELVTVEMRATEITWNEAPAVLASLRDVSERVRTNAQIEHLNSVLRAIRNVSQLVAREKDPTALTKRACQLLIEARGYSGAWIAAGDGQSPSAGFAQAGRIEDFAPFATSLGEGKWPPCLGKCLASNKVVAVHDLAVSCKDCPLSKAGEQHTALITKLSHGGNTLGLMGVSVANASFDDEEELSLVAEVAEDIAFALHTIEVERHQQETERRLQYAVKAGGVGLWDWDLGTNQFLVSAECKAQIGYRPEELEDSYEEWQRRIHPDDLESTLERIRTALEPPHRPYKAEFRLRHKDGSYRWIDARGSVDVGSNGRQKKFRGTHVDVTARRLEEDKLRLAQQVAHIGHWELDAYDATPVWSEEVFRIFGLDPGTGEPSFARHDTFVHPEEWPILDEAVRAGFESGTPCDVVFRILRPNQEIGWMHAIGKATRGANGKVVRLFGTVQDITERKLASQELAASYSRFRALFENSMAPIMIADAEGHYLDVNPAACELFGYGREQLLTMRVADLMSTAPNSAGEQFEQYKKTTSTRGEFAFVRGNGEHRMALWSAAEVAEGEHASVLQDITDLRTQEQRLREEKERAQRYLDIAAVMLLGLDTAGRITLVNRRGQEILGVENPEDLIGEDWFQFIPTDDREKMKQFYRSSIGDGTRGEQRVEGRLLTATGEQRRMVWHNAVVHDSQGTIVGTLSSGEDVTERREIESQLAQADRLSNMGMLAAGVAHEINNPLSYVLYNLESLTEELPELLNAVRRMLAELGSLSSARDLSEELGPAFRLMNPVMLDAMLDRFKDALRGTYRIRDVARGLGAFSRVEKDQLVPVNLMHVIDVAIDMAFNEIKYRARLVKDYGRKVPVVMASEGRLSQVFLNLIINATHAIDEGDLENNEIRVKTWAEGDQVCAQVLDTGSGIAPENLGKLFEPFFTTKKIGVGSGLGLPISKGIIEGYGGTIAVESKVGTGTCFTIKLPVGVAAAAAHVSTKAEKGPAVRGRILVVDDEDELRAAMVRMLREHDPVQAASGAQAKEILEIDQAFDLILSDIMMSDVSGMELHEWLTETYPRLATQFIFITGGAFTPRAREYLSKVDNIRLEKPFDVANLKKIVADRIHMAKGTRPT